MLLVESEFFDIFTTMFVFTLIIIIVVFVVIILLVVKFLNSNVNSKRSNWVKVETVTPKDSAISSSVPNKEDKKDLSQYCSYCGAKASPQEKICSSCGAEINPK